MNKLSTLRYDTHLRLDQNLGYHIDKFKQYPEDEDLIKSLIIYMSFNFQKNLFGFSTLDPKHFAKVMKHGEENLKRKHPNPIYHKVSGRSKEESIRLQEKHGSVSEYRILDSYLENAFLILQHEKTLDTYLTKDEFSDRITITDFKYIEDFEVVIERVGKTKKLTYLYKLNEKFELSLKKFFFNANIKTYVLLKDSNLEDWYLKLLSRITKTNLKGKNKIFFNIKELADLMNISTNTLDKPGGFSKLKNKINTKFNKTLLPKIKSEIQGLELFWVKGENSRYKDIPVIRWLPKSKAELEKENELIYNDLFFTELFKSLSLFYYNNYQRLSVDNDKLTNAFIMWLLSPEDYDTKVAKYHSTYVDHKGKHDDVHRNATDFIDKICKIGKINVKHNIISYKNGLYVFYNIKDKEEIKYQHIKDIMFDLTKNFQHFEKYYD